MRLAMVWVLVLSFSLNLMAQEYEIRFVRPVKAGDKCREISTGSSSQQSTVFSGDQIIKSALVQTTIEMDAETTILEIDKEGHSVKESLLVNSCVIKSEGKDNAAIEKGTVIIVLVKDGKVVFEIDGKAVDESLSLTLALVENLYTGGVSDDDIFGSSEKKKIGDSWKLNTEKVPADMARHGISIEAKNIDGSVKLEKLEKSGDMDCLFITAEMTFKDIIPKLPAGLTVESSAMMNSFSALFPIDTSIPKLDQTLEFKMQMTMTGRPNPDAPAVRIISTNERKSSHKVILVK
ncbi:MAG TPA: hypothetical protein DET40_00440 [Lentisphaeria bacterium]|nr:MAG: hypothetical protein A2X45_05065 [Lentisphaerae bacterium GWF2_50_93]HCE42001.1 hypothetical protein [Lentisphaeria bacterium]